MIPQILDKFENELGLLTDCIEGIAIEERNGMCEIETTYPIFSENYKELKRGNFIVADVNDTLKNQKFRIYKLSKALNGKVKVYAKHIFFDLARDVIEKVELSNASCEYALNELFRNSQFSNKFKGESDIINSKNFSMKAENLVKSIGGVQGSILDTFGTGAEILRDNRVVKVLNKRGHDNGVSIEYAKNMTGLNIDFDDSDLITRIKAVAKYTDKNNNEVIVFSNPKFVDSPLINEYETPFIKEIDFSSSFENGSIPTPDKLKALAEKYFRDNKCDQVKTNIKVEFIPLSKCVGYENIQDNISLCDTVTIKDYRYNLDTKAKVIKTYFNFLSGRYEKIELGDAKTSLGDLVGGGSNAGDSIENETSKVPPINDGSFPDTLPKIPTLNSRLYGFDSIELSWTFEAKAYYSYELYASKVKDFTPSTFDLLFEGQGSTFLHSAKPCETWYYKVRAVNSHGNATDFSNQIEVETVKIEDLSNYVSEMAIGDALIGELNLGRGWFGQLTGNYIDARRLTVTDGNGKRTFSVDDFGRVAIDAYSFTIKSKSLLATVSDDISNGQSIKNASMELKSDGFHTISGGIKTSISNGVVTVRDSKGYKVAEVNRNLQLFNSTDGNSSDFCGGLRTSIIKAENTHGIELVMDDGEDYMCFSTTQGDGGISDSSTTWLKCNRTGNVHLYKNLDFHEFGLLRTHINQDKVDTCFVGNLALRSNQVNTNYSSSNLHLNYWRGYNATSFPARTYVGQGNNDGSRGILYCKSIDTKEATIQEQNTRIGTKATYGVTALDDFIEDMYFAKVKDDRTCIIALDHNFIAQANTEMEYHVQVSGYEGSNFKIERFNTHILLTGGIVNEEVSVVVKARTRNQEYIRYRNIIEDTELNSWGMENVLRGQLEEKEGNENSLYNLLKETVEKNSYTKYRKNMSYANEIKNNLNIEGK
ncbi:phage tail spike protein [Clostridium chrysemydis]|uniref:phage tail spike protein n=1 Tax=Clostridium chrysemydis TaxID=2665504 RepID=UPI00188350A6|nr:phage tail spike protein [Clostridium chrysemydis]